MKQMAIELAEDILRDLEKYILAEIAEYRESWRYKELLVIIKEQKTDVFQSHPMIDSRWTMATDEIADYWDLCEKLSKLKNLLEDLKRAHP